MNAPTVKRVKIYAIIESVVEAPQEEIDHYLRQNKFRGSATVNYSQGGVTNIVTKEHIPLTMRQLDRALNGDH